MIFRTPYLKYFRKMFICIKTGKFFIMLATEWLNYFNNIFTLDVNW